MTGTSVKNVHGRNVRIVTSSEGETAIIPESSQQIDLKPAEARRLRDFLAANVPDVPPFNIGDYVEVLPGAENIFTHSRNPSTYLKEIEGTVQKVVSKVDPEDDYEVQSLDGQYDTSFVNKGFLELYTGEPVDVNSLNIGDIVAYNFNWNSSGQIVSAPLIADEYGLLDENKEVYVKWWVEDKPTPAGVSGLRRIYAAPVPDPVPFEIGSTVTLMASTSRAPIGSIGKVVSYKDGENGKTNGLVRIDWVVGGIPDQEEWVFFRTSRFAQSTLAAV